MTQPRSVEEIYRIYREEAQARKPELTDFTEGSINDAIAGSTAIMAQEVQKFILDKFRQTFFQSAEADDLEFLAVDHFGDGFAKPAASKAVGIVTFSRTSAAAGNVLIDTGTVVKTPPNANGVVQRFEVIFPVTMTGTEINASVRALEAGPAGNVDADEITIIETALTDPTITVGNDDPTSGGEDVPNDSEYRAIIERLIQQLKGATKEAILATALNVAGVETATIIELVQEVIEWDAGMEDVIGEPFKIARSKLYIADANGEANNALLQNVVDAILPIRACGVFISVIAAEAVNLDWSASITLDGGGPNFAELSNDPQKIIDTMTKYVQDLAIGANFNRALAKAYVMSVWGPAGTGDLTNFSTVTPSGDISADATEKFIPGTIEIV